MSYNWQKSDWPNFQYDLNSVRDALTNFNHKMGRIHGLLEGFSESTKTQAAIEFMVYEAIKTSEIEGEYFSRQDVLSSIQNQLGLSAQNNIHDRRALGVAKLMVYVRKQFDQLLTQAMLKKWHRLLLDGSQNITIGQWRKHKEPMQIISGAVGKQKVHFEAPPSSQVAKEMRGFIKWFNHSATTSLGQIEQAPIRAAIAHLYFESIHPFEDGNGRVGRAICEKALSQNIGRPILLSLSRTIRQNKKAYYGALKKAQKTNQITSWIEYFVDVVGKAQTQAEGQILFTLKKTRFFDAFENKLNERQLKVVKRMFESGPKGFKGGMSATKYMRLTRISKATATRDLQSLLEMGALTVFGGGRNTKYQLKLD